MRTTDSIQRNAELSRHPLLVAIVAASRCFALLRASSPSHIQVSTNVFSSTSVAGRLRASIVADTPLFNATLQWIDVCQRTLDSRFSSPLLRFYTTKYSHRKCLLYNTHHFALLYFVCFFFFCHTENSQFDFQAFEIFKQTLYGSGANCRSFSHLTRNRLVILL